MGTVRQRRKTKNSSKKVSKKVANARFRKQKAPIGMPHSEEILQHWSKESSIRQNYQTLGLMMRLNGLAGGKSDNLSDDIVVDIRNPSAEWSELDGGYDALVKQQETAATVDSLAEDEFEDIEEGTIERDQDGNVTGYKIQVVKRKKAKTQLGITCASVVDDKEPSIAQQVIKKLEEHAASEVKPVRYQAPGEIEFCVRCITKYGNDFMAMAKDLKLNVLQLTATQIKKKIEKYHSESIQQQQQQQ